MRYKLPTRTGSLSAILNPLQLKSFQINLVLVNIIYQMQLRQKKNNAKLLEYRKME